MCEARTLWVWAVWECVHFCVFCEVRGDGCVSTRGDCLAASHCVRLDSAIWVCGDTGANMRSPCRTATAQCLHENIKSTTESLLLTPERYEYRHLSLLKHLLLVSARQSHFSYTLTDIATVTICHLWQSPFMHKTLLGAFSLYFLIL